MLNKRAKFGAKIFTHFSEIAIYVLGRFILKHPVEVVVVTPTWASLCLIAVLTYNTYSYCIILYLQAYFNIITRV